MAVLRLLILNRNPKNTMKMITTKTPIKYWGGKQQLAPKIISKIPPHKAYVEPFFGGGAVFFAKPKSKVEIINDINDNMVNFYKIVKQAKTFEDLLEQIDLTLYSEFQYKEAKSIWKAGKGDDKVMRAWAVFVLSHQSFSGILGSSWAFLDCRNQAEYFKRVKIRFDHQYVERLESTQIFCRDAVNVIKNTDSPETFYFLDPPYINTDCGHYEGYGVKEFEKLLKAISEVKGKFLLTTYPTDLLKEYTKNHGWITLKNERHLSASKKAGRRKTEVFTMNYDCKKG